MLCVHVLPSGAMCNGREGDRIHRFRGWGPWHPFKGG